MKKNNGWFSIVIWMALMILIVLSAYVILAYIIPFMKSVKGVENTSGAYYQAYGWIEEALYFTKHRATLTSETGGLMLSNPWYAFQTFSSGTSIPQTWYGNSEYSTGHNIISQTEPIQLEIGNGSITTWNISFDFQVPAFTGGTLTLSGTNTPMINWILASENNTLYASGTWVTADNINTSNAWQINDKSGITLLWGQQDFQTFYTNNCWSNSGCILKMSVINDLVLLSSAAKIPYLEYQISFPSSVPDRYTRIESYGKSYGFQKKLDVRVPQQTVNQAFDFTVFQ